MYLALGLCRHVAILIDKPSYEEAGIFKLKLKLKLKIFIGMSAKLIANGHVQIYKYTEYGQ